MTVDLLVDARCEVAENPLWHPETEQLYWTDVPAGRLYQYDPRTDTHECVYHGEPVGGFTLQEDGSFLLFMSGGQIRAWRDSGATKFVTTATEETDTRFNDVVADLCGRVFCGTMPTEQRLGRLYQLHTDGSLTRLLEGVKVSNGLGFSPDLNRLYYAETRAGRIHSFAYSRETGGIRNRQCFVDWRDESGVPDGLAVDAEGHVWVAMWDGGCLVRFTPDGDVENRYELPVARPSSLTFGGPDGRSVFVTTAKSPDEPSDGVAGGLFRLRSPVGGGPWFRSAVAGDR
jgi:D-xylonolactonase